MIKVKIHQTDRRDNDRKTEAKPHGDIFHNQHQNRIHIEDVIAHDKPDDAFVYETRIRVKQRVGN